MPPIGGCLRIIMAFELRKPKERGIYQYHIYKAVGLYVDCLCICLPA